MLLISVFTRILEFVPPHTFQSFWRRPEHRAVALDAPAFVAFTVFLYRNLIFATTGLMGKFADLAD